MSHVNTMENISHWLSLHSSVMQLATQLLCLYVHYLLKVVHSFVLGVILFCRFEVH